MKLTALFALLVVIGATAHASVPTSPILPTRIHLYTLPALPSATAKAMGAVAAVPVVKGVTLISNSEAASIHGQCFLDDLAEWIIRMLRK